MFLPCKFTSAASASGDISGVKDFPRQICGPEGRRHLRSGARRQVSQERLWHGWHASGVPWSAAMKFGVTVFLVLAGLPLRAAEPNADCSRPFVFREARVNILILPYR